SSGGFLFLRMTCPPLNSSVPSPFARTTPASPASAQPGVSWWSCLLPASRADEVRHDSPPARQPPHAGRDQFHRIPGRVTKVKGLAPSRPLNLFSNADPVALQELPPGVECLGINPQGEVARPAGPMRG